MMNVIKLLMIGFVQLTNSQAISKEGETCGLCGAKPEEQCKEEEA